MRAPSRRELVAATERQQFALGVGLPGQVLEFGPAAVDHARRTRSNFPRRGMGFESGFAFPVFSGGRCIAILEFFSRDAREPEPALLLSARAIGTQIGRVHERKRGEELQALLVAELDHRAKNILAVVRGIAHLSFGSSKSLEEAQSTFDRRLDSIAKANDMLHAQSGKHALLGEIVREALDGCGAPAERVAIAGPQVCVDSSAAIMFSLAVHELCTNALKYGALSVDAWPDRARLVGFPDRRCAPRLHLGRGRRADGDGAGEPGFRDAHPQARHGDGDRRPGRGVAMRPRASATRCTMRGTAESPATARQPELDRSRKSRLSNGLDDQT